MASKKRTVDTWKKKKWYSILADPLFDSQEIGETVAIDAKNVKGRKIEKGLEEITNNIRDSHYKLKFVVDKVTSTKAETKLLEFDTKIGSIKRMIKRGKSKIENIFYVTTKDGDKIKVKTMFISGKKYATKTRREARNLIKEFLETEFAKKTTKEVWNDIIHQKLSESIKKKLVKLGYVNKVLITKAKIIK